jgi:hypothetical protein
MAELYRPFARGQYGVFESLACRLWNGWAESNRLDHRHNCHLRAGIIGRSWANSMVENPMN